MKLLNFVLFVLFSFPLLAQQLQTKIEQQYAFVGNDSLPRYYKKWSYNREGLLVEKQEFYYSANPKDAPGTLWREERMYYDTSSKKYELKKIQYNKDKEPQSETFKALYLEYSNDPAKCKPVWTKNLDNYGEYIKEDTFGYDKNGNLISYSFYNYQGNTSLFSDAYTYDRKGLRRTWRTYYHWTTVDMKGDVLKKKIRRRMYRFSYNKDGKLLRGKGKYYKTRYDERRSYDAEGRALRTELWNKQKVRNSKEAQKKQGLKPSELKSEHHLIEYQKGLLVLDLFEKNGEQQRMTKMEYKDSLPIRYEHHVKGKLSEERRYEYDAQGKIVAKLSLRYDGSGAAKYSVRTAFDAAGNPIEEQQLSGENVLSTLRAKYDEKGQVLETTLFLKTDIKHEKTVHSYLYF